MKFWNDPKIVEKTPIITVFLLEGANVGQMWRMWTQQSSLGQNPWSWALVSLALLFWLNFYRVVTPKARFAIWATAAGWFLNMGVILTVFWFQAHGR